jgi:hypothetical protein
MGCLQALQLGLVFSVLAPVSFSLRTSETEIKKGKNCELQ